MAVNNRDNVSMRKTVARTGGSFLLRLALAFAIVLTFSALSRAGGPNLVAGTTYFDPAVTGQPLIWAQGEITFYTDQGDLSSVLPNASANSFVASAFAVWASVPTAALSATSGGELAEDVTGPIIAVSNGVITAPTDITPSATDKPIGIVYDADGSVTDVLLGQGAGDASECFYNAVFGGADDFGTEATYQHALIVINGQCAQQSSQLTDVEYRLVRVIGNVLGLGWSQLNLNVQSGQPPATSDDYAGFPVMHYMDSTYCVPITKCYANPYQLTMDDEAAISRLYPVTAQNLSSFPGKQAFASTTARIYGSVFFTDTSGNATQGMQGVNVVARWINPATGQPSGQYAASSISGFLFTGNAGNPVTGFDDPLGNLFSDWGSSSSGVEGFFDLGGLQIPSGSSAQYQLTVEAIDPIWSTGVGPYAPYQVTPSGLMQPITVTVTAGENVQQNILMTQSAQPVPQWAASESWSNPAPVPQAGDWEGSLGSYGETGYFSFPVQANRTLSIAVTALDESGSSSETKLQPVIGIWPSSAAEGSAPPALTTSSFNTVNFAMTRLDAQIGSSSNILIGIADLRGDGRPDYHYHAQVLYADSVSPPRIGVSGGPISVLGTGFSPRLTATIGNAAVTVLQANASEVILSAPAQTDGPQSITLTDPATGGSTTLVGALTYGAAVTDSIVLRSGLNPQTPIGTQAANPITVRVLAADGVTPVAGASVGWSSTNSAQLSACGGASSCSVTTDQSGFASTRATPTVTGAAIITATLAPGVYSPSQSVSATLSATEPASAIGAQSQYTWIAQGATLSVPISVRVLSNGVPQNNATVNFALMNGSGTLSAASAPTNSSGYASISLSVTQFSAAVQVNACVAPSNAPCQQIYFNIVSPLQLNLQPVSGAGQISTGQPFQSIVVRAVDSASPPDPVLGATVNFQTVVLRPASGESGEPATPIVLNASQSSVVSGANGLVSIVPSGAGFDGPLQVNVMATAGISAMLDYPLQLLPAFNSGTQSSGTNQPILRSPLRTRVPILIGEEGNRETHVSVDAVIRAAERSEPEPRSQEQP
ncbi:MAG TPA: IPT/TIG domain-containing protein [Bryobacteraceae bacterium]|nr:IPT/TIG domain-containing protein [Bryobacteraceae bacterium]